MGLSTERLQQGPNKIYYLTKYFKTTTKPNFYILLRMKQYLMTIISITNISHLTALYVFQKFVEFTSWLTKIHLKRTTLNLLRKESRSRAIIHLTDANIFITYCLLHFITVMWQIPKLFFVLCRSYCLPHNCKVS